MPPRLDCAHFNRRRRITDRPMEEPVESPLKRPMERRASEPIRPQ